MQITRSTNETVQYSLENGTKKVIRGLASVFYNGSPDTEYHLGSNVYERIAPTAFDDVLGRGSRVWMAANHDLNKRVAKTPNTLALSKSSRGLEYSATLPDTTDGNDVYENVRQGIYTGSSFRANTDLTDKSTHQWSREGDKRILTHTKFLELVEVSPCYEPAFSATTTEAILRSADAWQADEETAKRLERAKNIMAVAI